MSRPPDITSTGNERIRAAAALARRRCREAEGSYLVEGPHAVLEALDDGVVEEVFSTAGMVATVADAAAAGGVAVTVVTEDVLARLADTVTPQGVVAVARCRPARVDEVVGRGILLVLCGVSDPGNAGTAIRTADAAGAAGVILTAGSVDPYNPKAVRAAAGSTSHLPLVVGAAVADVVAACREAGQAIVVLDAAGEIQIGSDPLPPQPLALFVGSEAHGMPDEVVGAADARAAVPLLGRAESLNLAAAVAVAIYAAAWSGQDRDPAAE